MQVFIFMHTIKKEIKSYNEYSTLDILYTSGIVKVHFGIFQFCLNI